MEIKIQNTPHPLPKSCEGTNEEDFFFFGGQKNLSTRKTGEGMGTEWNQMEEEPDKQKIKADTDPFMVSGKGNITESGFRETWSAALEASQAVCPWAAGASSERKHSRLQGKSLGVTWADCSSASQEMGREQN